MLFNFSVTLEGKKTPYTIQTFRGFTVAAVSAEMESLDSPVGSFQVNNLVFDICHQKTFKIAFWAKLDLLTHFR